jgi:DNA-binding response OmpR family regulator
MSREKKGGNAPENQKSAATQNPGPAGRRILLVDDEETAREMLGEILAAEGYVVVTAPNGSEALKLAGTNPVDLVLLDLNMPGQTGWETFQRFTSEHPLLPVIIITGSTNQVFTALGAGVGGLLEKPISAANLCHSVKCLLDEPLDSRLARQAGRATEFYYNSSIPKTME